MTEEMLDDAAGQVNESLFTHVDDTAFLDSLDDPVRRVAELQEIGPIVVGEPLDGGKAMRFGDLIFPNVMTSPDFLDAGVYAAVSWEAARAVFASPARFSSSANAAGSVLWGPNLSMMDPPVHTKFRTLLQLGFTPRLVSSWDETILQPTLGAHFDAIKGKGRADLVRELTVFFPYKIVGRVAGFEHRDIGFVADAFHRIMNVNASPEAAMAAGADLRAYAARLIEERRARPTEDLVSVLTRAEVDGNPIPDDVFVGMVIHLMAGGIDTVYRTSSNIVQMLLDNPEQFEMVKADRSLIPAVVEETLRLQGVASMFPRRVMEDTEEQGVRMAKGGVVFVMQAAANRDPTRWSNPHAFDLTRKNIAHMAFGNGPHACIGMHLARTELRHFVTHLLDDLPNLRWDPDVKAPGITGWTIRGTNSLPVVWDPR
ncbi:cytochrome P450 [Sphingopyxis terrae]|uniref:cytochrome P450 n=1 Tax=Sphingopyxis terrae TaxID=33052 RepID=UPI002A1591EE|nr:cytochrome P450 [Sphingopyxis terrae]MDX8356411.1 cytochrome P450 [Sphingopyxis terrae]